MVETSSWCRPGRSGGDETGLEAIAGLQHVSGLSKSAVPCIFERESPASGNETLFLMILEHCEGNQTPDDLFLK